MQFDIEQISIQNPFTFDKVQSISILIRRESATAAVSFSNGNTHGLHNIFAQSVPELNQKIEVFLRTLT